MDLPTEVWTNIACALPRGYLDDMLTCNAALTNHVLAASEPRHHRFAPRRRTFLRVLRCENGSLMVRLTAYDRDSAPATGTSGYTDRHVDCYNAEQLQVAVYNTWIADLSFEAMDPDIHNTLMKVSPRWQHHSTLHGLGSFHANMDSFLRIFEELVVEVGLIVLYFPGGLHFESTSAPGLQIEPHHFWNLPAIRNCDIMRVDRLPPASPELRLTSEQALSWLRIPPRVMTFKRLEIRQEALAEPIAYVLGQFQRDFMSVSDDQPALEYKITILLHNEFTLNGIMKNNYTKDVLQFYNDPNNANIFIIHRLTL